MHQTKKEGDRGGGGGGGEQSFFGKPLLSSHNAHATDLKGWLVKPLHVYTSIRKNVESNFCSGSNPTTAAFTTGHNAGVAVG
jgi:hypothetical protein